MMVAMPLMMMKRFSYILMLIFDQMKYVKNVNVNACPPTIQSRTYFHKTVCVDTALNVVIYKLGSRVKFLKDLLEQNSVWN